MARRSVMDLTRMRKPPARSGLGEPELRSTKSVLADQLSKLLDLRKLSQMEAAAITGMTQSKISHIRRDKLQNVSLERLMQALIALDQHVEIVIRPARVTDIPMITVAA
jgi:predicted XRE-type DNA-binding protein